MQPKIHILVKFVEGPWGGANQFLKALREYFVKTGVYSENPEDADIILFNSYPFGHEYLFNSAIKLKKEQAKIFLHRVDGPISLVRGRDKIIDKIIYAFNKLLADGTIFISDLCKRDNYALGIKNTGYEAVILGAPNPAIFNPEGKRAFHKDKIRLIATSWSGNIRKGFNIYRYLDEHLDFNKYEMTFVGNSPIEFNNIKLIKPVPSQELAVILKENDIYLTATEYEPFGQAVVEALTCGLPAVVTPQGGYLEVAGNAVEIFNNEDDVIEAIEKVAQDYAYYQSQIKLPTIDEISQSYYHFAKAIYEDSLSGTYHPKKVRLLNLIHFRADTATQTVLNKLQGARALWHKKGKVVS